VVAVDSFSSVWYNQQEVVEELTRQWSERHNGFRIKRMSGRDKIRLFLNPL